MSEGMLHFILHPYDMLSWSITIMFFVSMMLLAYTFYTIAIGEDTIFGEGKKYDAIKDDCARLKIYLLENVGSRYYENAKDRYWVLCK